MFSVIAMMLSLSASGYDFEVNGFYFNILSMTDMTVEVTSGDVTYSGDIVIPMTVSYANHILTVRQIGNRAFYGCSKVTSISLPSTISQIGDESFSSTNIDSLYVPNTIKYIGGRAFSSCIYLKKLIIEDGQEDIEINWNSWIDRPFISCPIDSIYMGRNIYREWWGAQSSIFNGISSSSLNIEIGTNVTYLTYCLFQNCTNIKSIAIPNNVKDIYFCAFKGCTNLESVILGSSIENIGSSAFDGCASLSSIIIPKSVSTIGSSAFANCSSLLEVTSKNPNPVSTENDCFSATTYWKGVLYVPFNSSNSFKNANGWNNFSSIIELGEDVTDDTYFNITAIVNYGGDLIVNEKEITNSSLSFPIIEKSNLDISLVPYQGYVLKSIILNGVDITNILTDNIYSITSLNENITIVVTFVELPTYLAIKNADNGTVSLVVNKGNTYTTVITPAEGWEISTISFNGTEVTNELVDNTYATPSITSDSELSVVYKQTTENSVKALQANNTIKVSAYNREITIKNDGVTSIANVYTLGGTLVTSETVNSGTTTIRFSTNNVYLVKIGNQTFKVAL